MRAFKQRFLFPAMLVVTVVLCTVGTAEVALRILKRNVAYQPDPDLIRSLRPHTRMGVYVFETEQNLNGLSIDVPARPRFIGHTYTNNLGFRMRRDLGAKGPDERRVLLMGDSYGCSSRFA